jgi:Cu/Ag efflux protein CusF
MKLMRFAMFMFVLAFASPLAGAANHEQGGQLTEGEVRKVDNEARKLTIKHGAIVNLDMPAMTMVFQVKDPAMLNLLRTGDKIKFTAEKANGQYTVTYVEHAR